MIYMHSKSMNGKQGRLNMASVEEVLKKLQARASPDQLEGMARYGMAAERRLGVSVPEMRKIAKEYGKDHKLALELWKIGLAEARIVAAMIDEPEKVTEKQMEEWVKDINSWDICDQVCMNLFENPSRLEQNPRLVRAGGGVRKEGRIRAGSLLSVARQRSRRRKIHRVVSAYKARSHE
jgi:3-methyladenine DNA glycosylase AlkD